MTAVHLESVQIRLVRLEDDVALAGIYGQHCSGTATFATEPPTSAEFRVRIEETLARHIGLVAETVAGELCGYAFATPYRSKSAYDWTAELSCYLQPGREGRGLGGAMCRTIVAGLRRQGYMTVLASVTIPNDASLSLAKSLGFDRIGTFTAVANKERHWCDVDWWQLQIQKPICLADSTLRPLPLDRALDPALLARLRQGIPWTEAESAVVEAT